MCLAETTSAPHPHGHSHGDDSGQGRDEAHGHVHAQEPDHGRGMGRRALVAGAAAALAAALPAPARAAGRATTAPAGPGYGASRGRVRDLTHTLTGGFPVYTFDNPVRRNMATIAENGFYAQSWTFSEHTGTHIDVPGHFSPGGRLLPQIAAAELIVPAVVVDVSSRVAGDPDTQVTMEDLDRYERRYGRIPPRAAVLMYSGWESRLPQGQAAFRGEDSAGGFHFPGFHADAVRWLLEHRGITCVGVDTLSLDPGASTTFDVHHLLLGADRYGLENVANLATIPPRGATMYVGAVPLEDGSGGPCRLIATW